NDEESYEVTQGGNVKGEELNEETDEKEELNEETDEEEELNEETDEEEEEPNEESLLK
ncbi:hypothetical protein Tco_0509942, partial [Tanacetum coccineum]